MPLKFSTKPNDRALIPEGTYNALCITVAYIGEQYNKHFNKTSPKLILTWEICDDDLREDFGRDKLERRVISETYTACFSYSNANLVKTLKSWVGLKLDSGDFDLRSLAGKPAMVTITHNQGSDNKMYANVSTVAAPLKGFDLGAPENPVVIYAVDEHDQAAYDKLPEWIQKRIESCKSDVKKYLPVNIDVYVETGEVIENPPAAFPVMPLADEDEEDLPF